MKYILLQNIADTIRFLYPEADAIFDFSKPIKPLDKEFIKLSPNRGNRKGNRQADIIVEVQLRSGEAMLVLIHIEIETGKDKNFPKRMYEYHYHMRDRYNTPVLSIAVFLSPDGNHKPNEYNLVFLDTELTFKYRTYHILDQSEEELLAMDNIVAYIVLACQKALLEGKAPDEILGAQRTIIARALITLRKYNNSTIQNYLAFLMNIVHVENKEINTKFVKDIKKLTGGAIEMTVIEVLEKRAIERGEKLGQKIGKKIGLKKGLEKGRAEERAKAESEKREAIQKMLGMNFEVETIADILGISAAEVKKINS